MRQFNFDFMERFLETGIFDVFTALLLTLLAFVVAQFVQQVVDRFVSRWHDRLGDASYLPGQLSYLLVVLLFVPGIFERLGIASVTAPIERSMQELFLFVPNLVGASLILVIGTMIARVIRALLNGCVGSFVSCLFGRFKLLEDFPVDKVKIQEWFASFVYVLIMFPVVIAALETLHIDALTQPAVGILNRCLSFVPNLFVALLLLGIGFIVSKFVSDLVKKLLVASSLDSRVESLTGCSCFAGVLAAILECVIVLLFVVEALNVLSLSVLTRVGNALISYLPSLLASALIILFAFFGASAVRKTMVSNGVPFCGRLLEAVICVFAGFMVLSQLGISSYIVNTAFTCFMIGFTFALAVAFGFGGRETAARLLDKLFDKKCSCGRKKDELQQKLPFED